MKYTKIPTNTFKELVVNAGILVKNFYPLTGEVDGICGATTGGINFNAVPTFSDWGEDIDNCAKNTKELKRLDSWEVKMSGTYISVTKDLAKMLVAVGDIDAEDDTHIIPRNELDINDFEDIWWVGDYSDVNTGENAGFMAIHLFNALSTGGFTVQSGDKAKGQMAFEFTGHYSIDAQDVVPYEIYIKGGESTPIAPTGIGIVPSTLTLASGSKSTLTAGLVPEGSTAEITWSVDDDTKAKFIVDEEEVSTATGKKVTVIGKGGDATITATVSDGTSTFTDTCEISAPSENDA